MSDSVLADHPFLADLDRSHFEVISDCALGISQWRRGETILLRGDPATACYLIIEGTVAIEIRSPGSAPRIIQTLHGGELLGWSWLFEPYLWTFDARAVGDSSAYALDATKLRAALDEDSDFGLALMRRMAKAIVNRLKATRLQVLDVYGR